MEELIGFVHKEELKSLDNYIRYVYKFDNGYGISVVCGNNRFPPSMTERGEKYEAVTGRVFKQDKEYRLEPIDLGFGDDVIGGLTKQVIQNMLIVIKNYKDENKRNTNTR